MKTPLTESVKLSRRDLLITVARSASVAAAPALLGCSQRPQALSSQPALRSDVRLGLDTYTVHRCLAAKDPANRRDLWWLIDRLPELGCEGLQIDPSHFPGSEAAILDRLSSAVEPRGLFVEFGMGGWDPQRLAERIRLTARFKGRAVRTFCGDERATPQQIADYLRLAPPALREASRVADDYGVDIAVENHGDFTAAQLKELLDRVAHPRVGACLDTGNSLFRREDPVACARTLAPYVRSMHMKDWTMQHDDSGAPQWHEAVLGRGQVPVQEVLTIVLNERQDLYLALETPVRPGVDEAETIRREWNNAVANAAAARQILGRVLTP